MRRLVSITCVSWAVGGAVSCGDDGGGGNETGPSATTTGTIDDPDTTFGQPPMTTTTDGMVDSSGGPPPGPGNDCLLEENDCTEPNQKCMPWSEDADRIPDRARCCPLEANPDLDGERCTVQEYDGSCLDSCEAGAMCLVDDPDSLEGFCRPFCNPDEPSCNGGEGTCKSFFELIPGSLTVPLCMDECDPLVQDCSPPSWHCIPDSPTPSGQSGFICVPPPPQEPLQVFEACGLANDCGQGLVCVLASRIPDGCGAASTCCTAYCSLSEGDAPCQAIDPQLECVSWMAPDPSWEDVGVCALPS